MTTQPKSKLLNSASRYFLFGSYTVAVILVAFLQMITTPEIACAGQEERQPGFFVRAGVGVGGTGQELIDPYSGDAVKIDATDAVGLAAIGFVINSNWTLVVESMAMMRNETFVPGSGPGTTHWDGDSERTQLQVNWYPSGSFFLIGGAGLAKYDIRQIRDVEFWFDSALNTYSGKTVFGVAGAGVQISRSRKFDTHLRALAFYYPETDMGPQTMAAATGYSVAVTVDWFPF